MLFLPFSQIYNAVSGDYFVVHVAKEKLGRPESTVILLSCKRYFCLTIYIQHCLRSFVFFLFNSMSRAGKITWSLK